MRRKLRTLTSRLAPIALALSLLICFARCTPTWLPDSSGFVFVKTSGAVALHNLKTGETKQLVDGGWPGTGVAVWPASDKVTIARSLGDEGKQIIIRTYDLQGNELDASPAIDLGGGEKEGQWLTNLAVSPDGKYVVAFAPGPQTAVIYDVARRTHRKIEKVVPLGYIIGMAAGGSDNRLAMTYDVSPLTPDGKGFVALNSAEDGGEPKFVYVPLAAGDAVELKVSDEDRKGLEKLGEQKERRVALVPRWIDGNMSGVCELQIDSLVVRLDVGKKTTTLGKDMASDDVFQHAEKNKVLVLCRLAEGSLLQVKNNELQFWRRNGETTPLAKVKSEGGFTAVSLSPDRQKLLLRLAWGDADRVLALDAAGRTLADLKFGEEK